MGVVEPPRPLHSTLPALPRISSLDFLHFGLRLGLCLLLLLLILLRAVTGGHGGAHISFDLVILKGLVSLDVSELDRIINDMHEDMMGTESEKTQLRRQKVRLCRLCPHSSYAFP